MKAIILGAGFGNRLGRNLPKPLIELTPAHTILDRQLNSLAAILPLHDITVVGGYRRELIMRAYPFLSFVYNDLYAETNTAASLAAGLQNINDDVLWMNGDVVFCGTILADFVPDGTQNLVWVSNHPLGDEEIKYTLDSADQIRELSKTVDNGLGEAIGINFVRKQDLSLFKSCLAECAQGDYFERAIELAIARGLKFAPVDVEDRFCVEVDFAEDLERAQGFVTAEAGDVAHRLARPLRTS